MDLSKMVFTADMHTSGEIRNIQHSGNPLPPVQVEGNRISPEMATTMAQSNQMMAEAWKQAVFWFPELPDERLVPGDEFDVIHKMNMGGGHMGMQSQTVVKQVFSLEEVRSGLAYLTVREKAISKSSGIAGGKTQTKSAGKGDTVFDLKKGMWLDLTVKTRMKMNLSNIPGFGKMTPRNVQHSQVRDGANQIRQGIIMREASVAGALRSLYV